MKRFFTKTGLLIACVIFLIGSIQAQSQYLNFTNLSSGTILCNPGQIDLTYDCSGISLVSIDVSEDGGSNWTTIASQIPASDKHFLWTIQREAYSGMPLTFRIYTIENPSLYEQVDNVVIYDIPILMQQSQSDVYCINSEVSIGLVATGTNLQYQWYRDGVLIPGANLPYYYFPSIKYENTGTYYCVVSNPLDGEGNELCSSVRTDDIVVYVARPTTIARQPETMYVNMGGSAYFEVDPAANGIPPSYTFSYQWYVEATPNWQPISNSTKIQGATSRRLYFKSVSSSDLNKKYMCRVSALCGVAYSDSVMLSQSEISFTTQPQDQSVCEATDITLTTVIKNTNNLTLNCYWMKGSYRLVDNDHISGSQTTTLTIKNANENDIGNYYLVAEIVGKGYKVTSKTASVWVTTKPVIVDQSPASISVNVGQKLELFVKAESTSDNFTYLWSKDGTVLTNQTSNVLVIESTTAEDGGVYTCKVSNDCGEVTSSQVIVGIITPGITGVNDFCDCEFDILSPRPNPTSALIDIPVNLSKEFDVSVDMTNTIGQIVYSLPSSHFKVGLNNINIDFSTLNLESGLYFVNIKTEGKTFTKKIMFVR